MRTASFAGRARGARLLPLFVAGLLVVFAVTATGAAADELEIDRFDSIVEINLPSRAAIDGLIARDVDLVEYVRDEPDGTITVNVVVTEAQQDELEAAGYEIGATVENYQTYLDRVAEIEAAHAVERASHEAAETGEAPESEEAGATFGGRSFSFSAAAAIAPEPHEFTINRVDYFQNYAGWFLSVEVYDRAVSGTGSTGPTVSFAWRTETGSYGSATTIPRFIDTDPTPDAYMYNRILVRIGPASPPYGPGTAPDPPAMIRVASSTPGVEPLEAPVRPWVASPLSASGPNFSVQYFSAYMDPTQVADKFDALTAEFGGPGGIVEQIELPNPTAGYQRKSMCVMAGTTACSGAPGTTSQAVYLEARLFGQDGGNNIRAQFRNPGVANAPLSVTVTPYGVAPGQSNIVVDLATSGTGALASTAAQVRDAINATPAASALVTAFTYAGNAGTGIVQARAAVNLSDFLAAPAHVQRGPFQMKVMRIGKVRDGSKTGVFLFCQQHAREWVTPITCAQTAELLLRNYGTDARTKELIDNLDIFILPSANPDGSHYSLYDYPQMRKNMTRHCAVTATSGMPANRGPGSQSGGNGWGVDLNRNSGEYSGFDGYTGASTDCLSSVYRGPAEYSEPESRNLNWVVDTFSNIKFANNVHTYGGYFMWAPGSYRGANRVSAPPPNHGIEAYFFAAADTVLQRIKDVRGTAVLPGRTGPIADVLYSAAGNGADDMWYRKGIIAYSFEAGSDRFSSTTTGTGQTAVGFMPSFATEGRFEALEFAAGNFGLLESALDYEYDSAPPVVDMSGPRFSQQPIVSSFKWINEPSVVYYTLDGSTPTFSSPKWERERMRGPGERFLFEQTTTVRWLAVDVAGNSSTGQLRFAVDANAPTTQASLAPAAINGYYRNPTVTLAADDDVDGGGAGIDNVEYRLDGGAWTTYTGPFQVTGDGGHTLEFFATDLAENVEATQTLAFDVDATKPTIALTTPVAGAQYLLGSTVNASFSCADATSGVASCVGTVPGGSPVDTSSVGFKTFTVDAADVAGNTESASRTYNVHWPFNGMSPPFGKVAQVQAGATFPLRFSLGGDRGLAIFADGYPMMKVCGAADSTLVPAVQNEPLSIEDGYYKYSWATNTAFVNSCRELVLKLADNTTHSAEFRFRK